MAFTDFVLALSALLGTFMVAFAGFYWMLRLKPRAVATVAPDSVRGRAK